MTTFWERVIATLVGTVGGFLFSIALFYLTDNVKRRRERSKLLQALCREFEYNVSLLQSWNAELGNALTQIAAGDHQVFRSVAYSRYSGLFTQQAFSAGVLFEVFDNEQAAALEDVLRFFNPGAEEFVNRQIKAWNDGTLQAKDIVGLLQFNQTKISEHTKTLAKAAQKCKTK